jgi:hypothetical protein
LWDAPPVSDSPTSTTCSYAQSTAAAAAAARSAAAAAVRSAVTTAAAAAAAAGAAAAAVALPYDAAALQQHLSCVGQIVLARQSDKKAARPAVVMDPRFCSGPIQQQAYASLGDKTLVLFYCTGLSLVKPK